MQPIPTNRLLRLALAGVVLLGGLQACSPSAITSTAETESTAGRPEGWTDATHGGDAEPNYEVVFPANKVNQITITIAPENWTAMQTEMTELLGEAGSGEGPGGFRGGPDGAPPQVDPPEDGAPRGPGGGSGGRGMNVANPSWVPATISFEGNTWSNVGVRYKGNSSLMGSWRSGSQKLPLKLDFDQFEGQFPEIENQRFYGFKQLSLSNNWGDGTSMREAVTYDLLEKAGLVAAETAFYEVLVDHGEGAQSLGLFTVIEVIDDTVVDRYFEDDSGNIYEADGQAASLAEGTAEQIKAGFQKENNETEADWSDIEELYTILHSDERTADPAAWRSRLEAIFDVDGFLEWLALSAVIQHWDTYGGMSHNYYLYDDPETGKLTWISWDHNLVLGASFGPGGRMGAEGAQASQAPQAAPQGQNGGGRRFGGRGGRGSTTLDKADVGDDWPLIRFLLDDPTYKASYLDKLETVSSSVFKVDELTARYEALAALLEPYAVKESDAATFQNAVQQLIDRTAERAKATTAFLAAQ